MEQESTTGPNRVEEAIGEPEPWEPWETRLVAWSLVLGVVGLAVLGALVNIYLL